MKENTTEHKYNIDVVEVQKYINDFDPIILDVRTKDEYLDGHIENAVLLDFYDPNFLNEIEKLDKSKHYLVYCRSARRSNSAVKIMKDKGFLYPANMLGGITKWKKNCYLLVK